jgi:glutamate 5-kinase
MESKGRIVIKVGSSSLTSAAGALLQERLIELAKAIDTLQDEGWEPVLVSSGAVATGLGELGWRRENLTMPERQAAAAVGQGLLMEKYNQVFEPYDIRVAQILLTRDDLGDRRRYINARNTMNTLLQHGVLPVVNENDTVVFAEIRFGDNDTLSALVAGLVEAKLLVILTDTDGFYSSDPHKDPTARLIPVVEKIGPEMEMCAGGSSGPVGTGGMRTKLMAARIAGRSGIRTVLASGDQPANVVAIARGEQIGTTFEPARQGLRSRKRWIAFSSVPRGTVVVDAGAANALLAGKKSLLAVGVVDVEGDFAAGSIVRIKEVNGAIL